MKKVILAVAALCFSVAASAQILIGGNLGYGMSSTNGSVNDNDWEGDSKNMFEIAPKFGFQLNDRMTIGFTVGYQFNNVVSVTSDPDDFDIDLDDFLEFNGKTRVSASSWRFAPYFRYGAANFGKCSFFVEASIPFTWGMPTKTHSEWDYTFLGREYSGQNDVTSNTRTFSWGIAFTPGFSYKMGEHCSLDLYVDVFSIAFNQKVTTTEVTSNKSITRNNNFYIGINSLPEHNLFRLGFNYAF